MDPYSLTKKKKKNATLSQDFTQHFVFRKSSLKDLSRKHVVSPHSLYTTFFSREIIYPQINVFLLLQKQEKLNHANNNSFFQPSDLIFTKPKLKYQKNCEITAFNKSKEPKSE